MNLRDIEQWMRELHPKAARLRFEVDHTGAALHVFYDHPTTMHGVWGLDFIEQFPPPREGLGDGEALPVHGTSDSGPSVSPPPENQEPGNGQV